MPGGLMNIASYGNENLILTGNPKKLSSRQLIINIQILVCKNLELIIKV